MAIIEAGRLGTRNRKFAGLILAGLGSVFAVGFAAIALGEAEGRLQVEIFDQATGQLVKCPLLPDGCGEQVLGACRRAPIQQAA
jgi:hypothetical protein